MINAPTHALLGRPLIGNGAYGAPGTGRRWTPGLLFGNDCNCGPLFGNGGAGGNGGDGGAGRTEATAAGRG